jgi:hypothetical protein
VYLWLWDRLPGNVLAKSLISTGLILGVVAVLWFWVFPTVEPVLLPFDDVQVGP